jgi:hypothetical protein
MLVPAFAGAQAPTLRLSAPVGSTEVIESTVTIDSPPSGATEWFARSDQRWLTVEPRTGVTPTRVTVRVSPAELPEGVRRATLRFVDDAGENMLIVPVTVTIGGAEPATIPAPAPVPPTTKAGGAAQAPPKAAPTQSAPAASTLTIPIDGLPPATRNLPYSQAIPIKGGKPPYIVQIVDGRLPLGLTLNNGAIAGITRFTGTYTVAVAVSDASSPPLTARKALMLQVIVSYQGTALSVTAPSLTLTAPAGRLTPSARIGVASGTQPLVWGVASDQGWLRVSPPRGMAPGQFQVDVDATGLDPGTYVGTLTVTMDGAPNSPMRIPVQVTVRR